MDLFGCVQSINTYLIIKEMKGHFMNMAKAKKMILKILLMIPALLLFSGSALVCQASELEATTETTTAASQEAATEESTIEVRKATPGDAWYSGIVGKTDTSPKTLDDIYIVLFWILVVVVVYVMAKAFIWIVNILL